MQQMQQQMANRQRELEMRMQEAQFTRQMQMMEHQQTMESTDADIMNMGDMLLIPQPPGPPQHSAEEKGSIDLGPSEKQPRGPGGQFASKKV